MAVDLNFDDYKSAFIAPTVTIGGNVYTIKPLSMNDYIRLQSLAPKPDANPEEALKFSLTVMELGGIPSEAALSLDAEKFATLADFFFAHLFNPQNPNTPRTNGTNSQPKVSQRTTTKRNAKQKR